MADRTLARRYARAMIALAEEAGEVDRVGQDLERTLTAAQANDDQLLAALSQRAFSSSERRGVLEAILPKLDVHPLSRNLLFLLLDKNRFYAFPQVVEAYQHLADVRANRVRVTVETAEPLTPQMELEVRSALERLTGREVLVTAQVRPELIAGMVARVGSRVYDTSLRSRLDDLQHRLIHTRLTAEA